MHLLLIEDNNDLAIEVADFLESQGHTIDAAADGVTGLHLAVSNDYDAIVLDLMLPGLDGLELCRRLRSDAGRWTPVLMLTARDTLEDRLTGFDQGADDYLVKPFSLRELLARLTALERRGSQNLPGSMLRVEDLELNMNSLEVRRAGRRLSVSPTGLKILEVLMRAAPGVVRRERIERALWGDEPPDGEALRVHIHNLRTIIDKPFDTPLLHTVRGIGYRLAPANVLSS
ncbi:MAG TPA: response regulator transcription factor [Sedimenticola sp.]|nr:response regulator transcription factor [Sedimenticola sp.]